MRYPFRFKGNSSLFDGTPILVAEDDVLQALDLVEALQAAGASVIGPVGDLSHALELAREGACRAAILDFRLGSEDATSVGNELDRQQTPFVIHTGYDCRDMLPGQWRGCRLVQKPANIERLVYTVAALVRWQRLIARRRKH